MPDPPDALASISLKKNAGWLNFMIGAGTESNCRSSRPSINAGFGRQQDRVDRTNISIAPKSQTCLNLPKPITRVQAERTTPNECRLHETHEKVSRGRIVRVKKGLSPVCGTTERANLRPKMGARRKQ